MRQNYIPTFHNLIVKRLELEGKDVIPEAIQLMDDYFLTKEDWDAIVELGVGPMSEQNVKIPAQTKSAFTRQYDPVPFPDCRSCFYFLRCRETCITRGNDSAKGPLSKSYYTNTYVRYNQMSHPMPFMKATNVFAPKVAKKDVPDIEDAIVESEDEAAIGDESADAKKAEEDSMDISKDKYVKVPKKGAAKGKRKTAGGEEKPKATKGKAASKPKNSGGAATKGRGKAKK